jgi:hypothetical protein
MPGDPRDFTPLELENGIAGNWVKTDPRSGLAAERVFKAKRDKAVSAPENAEPDGKIDIDGKAADTSPQGG